MQERVLIIHGWESNSRKHWFLKEKERLEKLGYQVSVPDMPNSYYPKKEEWLKIIEEFKPNQKSILIGHSLGGVAILRYLERTDKKVGKSILIATPKYLNILKNPLFSKVIPYEFFKSDVDYKKVKKNCNSFVIINQTHDLWVPLPFAEDLAYYLNAKLVIVDGGDHFKKIDHRLLEKYVLN